MSMIRTAYYRVYYCLYVGLRRSTMATGWALAFTTILYFSVLLFLNLITILCVLTIITRYGVYRMWHWEWFVPLSVILNSFLFLSKQRYLKVFDMFKNEEKPIRNRRRAWCVVYIVMSFVSVMLMYYILGELGLWYYNPTQM